MKRSIDQLRQVKRSARVAFARLTQREQIVAVGGGIAALALAFLLISLVVQKSIARQQHRIDVKRGLLSQLLAMRGEYKVRQQERATRLRTLSHSNIRLISLVEDAARQAGVEIGQLRPEDSDASSDGVIESRVDLRAAGLSVDRLQEFINLIEAGPGIVITRHLKIVRPYRKDTAEIELTVSTFKLKA